MKRTRQFGGKYRSFLPDSMLEKIPESDNSRLTEDQRDVIQVMREGFNTLSDMQKRVIMLMVDQNMSERKVAAALGIEYPTVLNHLNRARKKLKKYVMQNLESSIYSVQQQQEQKENEAEDTDTSTTDDTDESN